MLMYPSRERILRDFDYVKEHGTFIRKRTGKEASTLSNGYPVVCVGGKQYPRSHLVWIVETGQPPRTRLRHKWPGVTRFDCLSEAPSMSRPAPIPVERRIMKTEPLGYWDNERDNPALARIADFARRTGTSIAGISVMTLRLLDPGEE